MRFQPISIGAAEADGASPRTNPELVPESRLVRLPAAVPGTSQRPTKLVLTREGTSGHTGNVDVWMADESGAGWEQQDNPAAAKAALKWYKLTATTVAVAVGAVTTVDVYGGLLYLQPSTNPAAASTLKVGFA